ncbi:hypothetical protein AB0A71_29815 [Kitasatospora aureofaciens]|uniref:hypothetical protein n=1 Tax=Kitasatospora aureofaciens TaxID=1894 RepID=UPI0033E0BF58
MLLLRDRVPHQLDGDLVHQVPQLLAAYGRHRLDQSEDPLHLAVIDRLLLDHVPAVPHAWYSLFAGAAQAFGEVKGRRRSKSASRYW